VAAHESVYHYIN